MEPEPQSEESAAESLRQRLARYGRLEGYEEDLARRRRERWRNPQLAYDDEYRVRQRVAAQQVFNQFFGVSDPPVILTGEHHHNPSFAAMGGRIGQAQRGRPVDTSGNPVDTKTEVLRDTK